MPLYKTIIHNNTTSVFVWKIEESLAVLTKGMFLKEESKKRLANMKSVMHQKGFVSVRHLLKAAGYSDLDLYYTNNGKPHLTDGKHISITHSFEFSALIVSNIPVGIDIEKNREKIKIIQHKFVNFEKGFINPNDNYIEQLTTIWGAKESLYKMYPYGGLTFKNDIDITSFSIADSKTHGIIKKQDWHKQYDIFFHQIESYTLVYALEK